MCAETNVTERESERESLCEIRREERKRTRELDFLGQLKGAITIGCCATARTKGNTNEFNELCARQ